MSVSDFEILTKIGDGAYSTVYKVRRLIDRKIYALKKVSIEQLSEKERKNALNEVRIMASIQHPNVISYKQSFISDKDHSLNLVMEFADSGDLLQKIQNSKRRSVRLNEKFVWSVLIQVTMGLNALHQLGVHHRDLKSANVFLNKDGTVKLGDMNVSKVSKDGFLKTQTGTPYYASPEVWKDMKYNNKSDIWSLGCVIYEMVSLKPPFRADDMEGLYSKVLEGSFDPIPKVYSKDLADTLNLLLNPDPDLRPSCDKILELESVSKHMTIKTLQTSTSTLLNPIKIPSEINMLSQSLPQAKYEGFPVISSINTSKKLPEVSRPYKKPYKYIELHSIIQNSSDRMKRIREIYLSPSNLYLSPQIKKSIKYVGYRKNYY
jgi:NIMA (never in mitosis gene a)-related kinase